MMEAYDDAHFTDDGSCAFGPKCCHCAGETIQPFQIPNAKVMLWDHQHCGLPQIVHLSHYRKPLIRIKNKIIGSGSGMVKMKQGIVRLTAVGTLMYNIDCIDGGLHILLNQFQENNAEDQLTAPIIFAKNTSIPSTKEEEYYSDLKFISEQCHFHSAIDPSKFVKMRVKCLTKGLSCQILVEMISMSTKFIATPIPPIPTVITALSNRLNALSSRKEMQTGFIIMDKYRKLVLLLENDPKVFEFPIVGVWVSGVPSVIHPFVWISFLRYISCAEYTNRLCLPPQPFLLALYSSNCEVPEYYDCITKDGSQNLSYDLYNGCAVASVSRFPTLDVTVTDIELSRVADKTKWKYFVNAESQLLSGKQQIQNAVQSLIVSNTDDMPQISPVPQPVKMIEPRPLVPDLSLAASRNNTLVDPQIMEDRNVLYTNYENNNPNDLIRETMCPAACVYYEPIYSSNEDSPFISDFVSNADCFKEQLDAINPVMNNVRITDDAGFQNNTESSFELNSYIECSNSHVCTDIRLLEGKQISDKENDISLTNRVTSKPSLQENVPIRSNSKMAITRPTRIPKPKRKQTLKNLLPTSSKPTPAANSDPEASDLQKVLLASASTMTSIVWPPTQGAGNNKKKTYVDEVLQTDELDFGGKHCCHAEEKTVSRPVVECAATQTSICEKKLTNDKEFHCVGCCRCCANKCKVRKNCLRKSLACTCCHSSGNDELQSESSCVNLSVMEDPFSDIFSSDFSSCEEDNLFLGESASTITRDEKQNFCEDSLINMRHKNKRKDECNIGDQPHNDDCSEEEDLKLYNIIQAYSSDIPVERTANTAKDASRLANTLFHSTSESTKKFKLYVSKYVDPETLSEVAMSYNLAFVNDVRHHYPYADEQKKTLPEEQGFKPSPHDVLCSQFSVATNRHLEKHVFI